MGETYDIIVAGGGIAGLTAGLTAARLGRKTLVLTGDFLGGQLLSINKIDGYPGFPDGVAGYELCPMAQEQAASAGAQFEVTELTALVREGDAWLATVASGERYAARACVIATGATLKTLGVPGEERLRGYGVSHCASCDAPLLRDKVAAVVGGGDSAAQEALVLADAAAKVFVIHRGETLTAQPAYRDALMQHPKVELRLRTVVEEVLGESEVAALRVRDGAGATAELSIAGFFAYIGLEAKAGAVSSLLALDREGRILTDAMMRTELVGLCAAGAVRAGWAGRAIASAGEGAQAAVAADRYIASGDWRVGAKESVGATHG